LLFAIAFEMVLGVRMRRKGQAAEEAVEEHVRNIAAFPLAIPLMAGPGAITATVLLHRPSNDLRPTSIIFEETEVSDLLFYFASTLETPASPLPAARRVRWRSRFREIEAARRV
jgi:small neutral amino acid transporter SnatA (MarC family)